MSPGEAAAVIRRIRSDEVDVYRAFRLRALADAPDAFGDSYALAIARPPDFWRQRVADTSAGVDSVLMVAADAATGTWLGMTGCYVDDPSDGSALVVSVWVAPEARRRRLARRLLDAVVEWAPERKVRTLRLWVTETNQAARALYLGAGFVPTGSTQPLPSNPTLQELEMAREI
jgi:ribosomal protein S18 acetylase RimI-like enzyme